MTDKFWLPRCILCKEPVNLALSSTDEYGRPVHEDCRPSMPAATKPQTAARIEPERERLSLMTMLMSAGWN